MAKMAPQEIGVVNKKNYLKKKMEVKLHASFVKISRVEIIRLGLFKEI